MARAEEAWLINPDLIPLKGRIMRPFLFIPALPLATKAGRVGPRLRLNKVGQAPASINNGRVHAPAVD
jgi:hypothetical protein